MRNLNLTFGDYFCQVPLLLHQKQALAWLLWRESQKPQGGILGKSGIMERANKDIVVLFHMILSTPLGLLPSVTVEKRFRMAKQHAQDPQQDQPGPGCQQ